MLRGTPPLPPMCRTDLPATAFGSRCRDTPLNFQLTSRDVKVADANGTALPGNASQQAFQHASGDASPRGFAFTVLGLLP